MQTAQTPHPHQSADSVQTMVELIENSATSAYFGYSIALSADASVALVGAYYDNPKGPSSGSVYVLTRNGDAWVQRQKLTASDGAAGDYFGISVALNADASIALIGAHGDDDRGSDSGSVYVFTCTDGTWTQQQKLLASDGKTGDAFGVSVALNADASVALIGAPRDDDKATDAGSVYVFTRLGSVWTQQQKLLASDGAANDWFGVSVALNTDASIAFIGACFDDDKGTDSGSVYVFMREGDDWIQKKQVI